MIKGLFPLLSRDVTSGLPGAERMSGWVETFVPRIKKQQGLTMKEMAQQLSLSPRTLETYRARALEKLELKTRAELVRYAIQCGWLTHY